MNAGDCDHRTKKQQRGQCIYDGQASAGFHHAVNLDGQGRGAGSRNKKGDHEVIERDREGQECTGEDSRPQERKKDPRGCLPTGGSQIPCSVQQGEIEVLKSAQHHHGYKAEAKRDVSDPDCGETQIDPHGNEEQQHRKTHQYFRQHQRQLDEKKMNLLQAGMKSVERHGRQGAQQSGRRSRPQCDHEASFKRFHYLTISKEI